MTTAVAAPQFYDNSITQSLLLFLPPSEMGKPRVGLPLPLRCGTLPFLRNPNKLYKSVDTKAVTARKGRHSQSSHPL